MMTNRRRWLFVIFSLICGLLLSLQARINSFVASDLGDSFAASIFVFASGGLVVTAVLSARRSIRAGLAWSWRQVRNGSVPIYLLLGGIGAIMGILAQTFAVQVIGVALFSLCFIFGQMTTSSTIDHFGWSIEPPRRLTGLGVFALLIALGGVTIASSVKFDDLESNAWIYLIAVLIAGIGVAVHMAFNGQITALVQKPHLSIIATYLLGNILLFIIGGVLLLTGRGDLTPFNNVKTYYVVLGIIGPFIVASSAVLIRYIGPLLFTLGMVTGQLIGSMLLDYFWPVAESLVPTWSTLLGSCLTLVSLLILQLWGQQKVSLGSIETDKAEVHI